MICDIFFYLLTIIAALLAMFYYNSLLCLSVVVVVVVGVLVRVEEAPSLSWVAGADGGERDLHKKKVVGSMVFEHPTGPLMSRWCVWMLMAHLKERTIITGRVLQKSPRRTSLDS